MEASFVVPNPDGKGGVVLNGDGEVMRRTAEGSEEHLQAPRPAWWVDYFDAFQEYFTKLIPDMRGRAEVEYNEPGTNPGTLENCTVVFSSRSSKHNGVWLLITPAHGAAYDLPLHFVDRIKLVISRPGAHYIPRPTIFKKDASTPLGGLATHFGAALVKHKGYVLPERFVGKIQAPICPFCEEEMVLSLMTENLGQADAKAQRHLWMCRSCSPNAIMPSRRVTAVALELKNADKKALHAGAHSAHPDSPRPDGGEAGGQGAPA